MAPDKHGPFHGNRGKMRKSLWVCRSDRASNPSSCNLVGQTLSKNWGSGSCAFDQLASFESETKMFVDRAGIHGLYTWSKHISLHANKIRMHRCCEQSWLRMPLLSTWQNGRTRHGPGHQSSNKQTFLGRLDRTTTNPHGCSVSWRFLKKGFTEGEVLQSFGNFLGWTLLCLFFRVKSISAEPSEPDLTLPEPFPWKSKNVGVSRTKNLEMELVLLVEERNLGDCWAIWVFSIPNLRREIHYWDHIKRRRFVKLKLDVWWSIWGVMLSWGSPVGQTKSAW